MYGTCNPRRDGIPGNSLAVHPGELAGSPHYWRLNIQGDGLRAAWPQQNWDRKM